MIDTALHVNELEALKKHLLRLIELLPSDAYIGCISYGWGVTVWDLGYGDLNKCYTIRGNRPYQPVGGESTLFTTTLSTDKDSGHTSHKLLCHRKWGSRAM
eukprot:Tbor_TRINITY_DN5824_c1_g1::TRINITY_DN5824_c1_g1_i1::g.6071::m.6071